MTDWANKLSVVGIFLYFSLLFILSGCGSREHMSPEYGKRNQEFYAKQRVYHAAATEPPQGLDSEEAAIGHATYRKNLGGSEKAAKDPGSRVLLLEGERDGKN